VITRKDLAIRSTISVKYLADIEEEVIVPSIKTIARIAVALNVTIEYLLIEKEF